jgi:hypothetical protein
MVVSAALIALAGCAGEPDQPLVPRDEDVARLEAVLAKNACVGTLGEWERSYRLAFQPNVFWPGTFKPEFDSIQFRYRHTGPVSIRPARNIVPLGADHDWPDLPAVRTVTGKFNVKSGRLNIERCEPARAMR